MRQIRTSGGSASPIIDSDIPDDVAKPASAIPGVVARVTLLSNEQRDCQVKLRRRPTSRSSTEPPTRPPAQPRELVPRYST
jgi:hypothetical protein